MIIKFVKSFYLIHDNIIFNVLNFSCHLKFGFRHNFWDSPACCCKKVKLETMQRVDSYCTLKVTVAWLFFQIKENSEVEKSQLGVCSSPNLWTIQADSCNDIQKINCSNTPTLARIAAATGDIWPEVGPINQPGRLKSHCRMRLIRVWISSEVARDIKHHIV